VKTFIAALFVTFGLINTAFAQSVTIDITLNPMGDFRAKTSDVKGFALLKGDQVTAENITVNLKSLKTGLELRDKHTQKYLDTVTYPEAILVSASGKAGKGSGKLKIRGIEKDVEGTFKIEGKMLKADFKVNIADYGIKDINYMGVGVEDIVVIHVVVPVK
jgi:polyisoprenoid-binding protein YceI